MIIHIALFKWKSAITQKQILKVLKEVQKLKHKVPGIIDIYCGANYHKRSKGLTHGIVIVAKNQKALDDYRKHVDHITVAKIIDEMVDDGVGCDFKNL